MTAILKTLRGIRDNMPSGYLLGRTAKGVGPPHLIRMSDLVTDPANGVSGGGSTTPIPVGANPTATASDTAVNGTAATFLRSDGAPAVQKCSSSQFGLCEVDGTTITASGGVISSAASGYAKGTIPTVVQVAFNTNGGNSVTFGVAPTNGNLLVAMAFNPNSQTNGTGWTIKADNTSGTDYGLILTKVAGAGESTTQSPMSGVSTTGAIMVWELNAASTPTYIFGQQQAETNSQASNTPNLLPNSVNCLGLSAVSVVPSPTINSVVNIGTQDVLSNTNTRYLAAGHTDLSQTPMVGIVTVLSSSGSTKGGSCVIHS